ncbi:MAG: hypothetical protein GXO35_01755 [Gammaproteobacteria bacterium]|nr:hypothetical protein [Gammaproteobacteria bacterium]
MYIVAFSLLYIGYYVYIVPKWAYYGFAWTPNWVKVGEALFLLVLGTSLLPSSFSKPSDFYAHFQFLIIIPMLVLFSAMDQARQFIYMVFLGFGIIVEIPQIFHLRIVWFPKFSRVNIIQMLLLIGYSVIVSLLLLGGLRYMNFNLRNVYIYRNVIAVSFPKVYGYINSWVAKVVFPLALALSLVERRRKFLVLSFIGSWLMFGLTSHKAILFYPIAVILIYKLLQFRCGLVCILLGYTLIPLLALFDYWFYIFHQWFATLFLRRALFVPALINFFYYDFFSQQGYAYWAYSKITLGLFPYKFETSIPYVIGEHFFPWAFIGANTGWIGSGYANAGFVGLLIYATFIGFLLTLLNAYQAIHERHFLVAVTLPTYQSFLLSSDLLTALFTHGTLLMLALLLLFCTKSSSRAT